MDTKHRKLVLRSLSNGLYVVTSRSPEGLGGATITWLTQASFQPPLLVACVRPEGGLAACLDSCGRAVLHVVGEGQEEMAQAFFSRPAHEPAAEPPTLGGFSYTLSPDGLPILDAAHAYALCRVEQTYDAGGDHRVVVLRVEELQYRRPFEPLTVRSSPWQYGG